MTSSVRVIDPCLRRLRIIWSYSKKHLSLSLGFDFNLMMKVKVGSTEQFISISIVTKWLNQF